MLSLSSLPSIRAEMIRRPRNGRTVRPTACRVARMYRTVGGLIAVYGGNP